MPLASRFTQYFTPVLQALRALGSSARPAEVYDWIAERLAISDEARAKKNKSGGSQFENDIAWARFYLARTGYLDSSKHGVWSLTEKGLRTDQLSDQQITEIIRQVQTQAAPGTVASKSAADQIEHVAKTQAEEFTPEEAPRGYRERTLEILQKLPSQGFERLCQRLLRESGFQQVKVTGRSGDGGIDGIGILQVTPFVSFKVLFQCKRWTSAVGPTVVRDFRGAMMGRADKGLILTTAMFFAGCAGRGGSGGSFADRAGRRAHVSDAA